MPDRYYVKVNFQTGKIYVVDSKDNDRNAFWFYSDQLDRAEEVAANLNRENGGE